MNSEPCTNDEALLSYAIHYPDTFRSIARKAYADADGDERQMVKLAKAAIRRSLLTRHTATHPDSPVSR